MSGIMNLPEDQQPRKKVKLAAEPPERTIPGRINQPKPIPAGQRSTNDPTQPVKKAVPTRSTGTRPANIPMGGNRSADDNLDPKRKAILRRLRMKRNAQ